MQPYNAVIVSQKSQLTHLSGARGTRGRETIPRRAITGSAASAFNALSPRKIKNKASSGLGTLERRARDSIMTAIMRDGGERERGEKAEEESIVISSLSLCFPTLSRQPSLLFIAH